MYCRHTSYPLDSVSSQRELIYIHTLRYDDFRPRAVAIVRRMLNQGGSKDHTLRQISKAVNRHPIPFQKFSMPAREIVKDITQNCLV